MTTTGGTPGQDGDLEPWRSAWRQAAGGPDGLTAADVAGQPVTLESAGVVASALLQQIAAGAEALQALADRVRVAAGRGEITVPDLPSGRGENLATALEGIASVAYEVDVVVTRHGRRIVEQLQTLGDH